MAIDQHLHTAVHKRAEWLDPTLATALAVPFIFALVWWNVRRLRQRHHVD